MGIQDVQAPSQIQVSLAHHNFLGSQLLRHLRQQGSDYVLREKEYESESKYSFSLKEQWFHAGLF